MSNDGPRYQARRLFKSNWCDTAYVLDTMRLDPWAHHIEVAECPDLATAQKIALALNRTADT